MLALQLRMLDHVLVSDKQWTLRNSPAFLGRQLVRNLNSSAIKIATVKKYPPKHREKVSLLLALTELH